MGESELHACMQFSTSCFSGQFTTKPVHNWESTGSHIAGFIESCSREIQRLQVYKWFENKLLDLLQVAGIPTKTIVPTTETLRREVEACFVDGKRGQIVTGEWE